MMVTSQFGKTGPTATQKVHILSQVLEPVVTWKTRQVMYRGQNNKFVFQVYAPNEEGEITVDFGKSCEKDLDAYAKCSCDYASDTIKTCTIDWPIEATAD